MFFLVCDGLKGLPEVVGNVWPLTIVQTCIIHLIRNTFRLASKRDWDALQRNVKPDLHRRQRRRARRLDELAEIWGKRYAAITDCGKRLEEFIPFLDYDVEIRSGDLLHQRDRSLSSTAKNRGLCPTDGRNGCPLYPEAQRCSHDRSDPSGRRSPPLPGARPYHAGSHPISRSCPLRNVMKGSLAFTRPAFPSPTLADLLWTSGSTVVRG